jgi:hypothetical protein
MIDMLSFSAPLVAAGALVGLIYNDAAAVVSAQAMVIVFQAIGYGIAAWLRRRRAEA